MPDSEMMNKSDEELIALLRQLVTRQMAAPDRAERILDEMQRRVMTRG